jgi:Zn-dependent protease with chaperone function
MTTLRPLTIALLIPSLLLAPLFNASPAHSQTISDPDLFEKSLEAANEALAEYGDYDNPTEQARVSRVAYELAQQSDFQSFPFTFRLIDMPVPNAFALPGGQIFVTRGMLDLGLSDDMLANLIGHEIGHVTLQHYKRMQRKATLLNVLGNALLVGVILGADRGNRSNGPQAPYDPRVGYESRTGDLIQGAAATSLVLSELLLRNYSREHEDESDQEGQRLSALAGYDPDGARALWALMESRAPQAREFGYWQTHPFGQDRERAAQARKGTWKIQPRKPADAYRQRTQTVLLQFADKKQTTAKPAPPPREGTPPEGRPGLRETRAPKGDAISFLRDSALAAWPQGKSSDVYRLQKLHALRDRELAKPLLSRDYGRVLQGYRDERTTVQKLNAEEEILPTLDREIAELDGKRQELYPKAVELLAGGLFETSFLVSFLSNFPDAAQVPQVALSLGDAYSRLNNQTEAVTQYLAALQAAPESPEGKKALAGLRVVAPSLKRLAALQQLADQGRDPELRRLAGERLGALVKTYDDVADGGEYLRRFPEGPHVAEVITRLNTLADNLYGEVVLYQGLGDATKAMERINKILTHAPLSPAAGRLRERTVIDGDKES